MKNNSSQPPLIPLICSWHDRARWDYESRLIFDEIPEGTRLIAPLFFGLQNKNVGAIGTYIEAYIDLAGNFTANTLSYYAPYSEGFPELKAKRFTRSLRKGAMEQIYIACQPVLMGGLYQMHIWFPYIFDETGSVAIRGARAEVKRTSSSKDFHSSYMVMPWLEFPDMSKNVASYDKAGRRIYANVEALCPNCLGNGSELTMHIPKADWQSGATGYHLYSCNRVSGREACEVCGGSGADYLPWYLDENPELKNLTFRSGSGVLVGSAT